MTSAMPTAVLSLLAAGFLTFCAPQPAHAQPAASASGEYINCRQLAADVGMAAKAMVSAGAEFVNWNSGTNSDWYTRTVIAHARSANKSVNPSQYVRDLHKVCMLENA